MLLEKFGAIVVSTLGIGALLWAAIVVFGPPFDLHVAAADVAAATFAAVLLAVAFGAIALFLGCWRGKRGMAVGITSAVAVATYLLDILAPSMSALKPAQELSPFYYYLEREPLRYGLDVGHAGVLVAITAATIWLAVVAFDRRDLAA